MKVIIALILVFAMGINQGVQAEVLEGSDTKGTILNTEKIGTGIFEKNTRASMCGGTETCYAVVFDEDIGSNITVDGGYLDSGGLGVWVTPGTTLNVTISVESGFVLTGVELLGTSSGSKTNLGAVTQYTLSNIRETMALVTTTEKVSTYNITSSAATGGTVTPANGTVSSGSSFSATVKAVNNYAISTILVDGVALSGVDGLQTYTYTWNNITSNHHIEATFKKTAKYTVTTSVSGQGGTVTPLGDTIVDYDNRFTVYFKPNTGYVLDTVTVNGALALTSASTNSYTISISRNTTIVVTYRKNDTETEKNYTIAASAGNGGSITPSGNATVKSGGSQTYTITPNTGYIIDKLLVDGSAVSATSSYSFKNVTANHTISVTFVEGNEEVTPTPSLSPTPSVTPETTKKSYIITATAGENGTITPTGKVAVKEDEDQEFLITPDDGYYLDQLFVDGEEVEAETTYIFTEVSKNHTIEATFAEASDFSLEIRSNGFGEVSESQNTVSWMFSNTIRGMFHDRTELDIKKVVTQADNVVVNFFAYPGYEITGIYINGEPVSARFLLEVQEGRTYKISRLEQDLDMVVIFGQKDENISYYGVDFQNCEGGSAEQVWLKKGSDVETYPLTYTYDLSGLTDIQANQEKIPTNCDGRFAIVPTGR
ncbi:MAG: InlB B-repeat-containing protein [Anaerorhabdus sp.]